MDKEFEALEKVNKVLDSCYEYEKKTGKNAIAHISKEPLIEIQQYLQNAQELEKELAEYKKILEFIKEKNVNFDALTDSETLDDYNSKMNWSYRKLTQEEFDLLKRWSEK
jgi:hypothetical protein